MNGRRVLAFLQNKKEMVKGILHGESDSPAEHLLLSRRKLLN
jgi:hypothetical protein